MATDKIMVDDEEIAGVELSKEEKKRLKRQEKKLKKFGLKDESKMGKMELFFYRMEKRRKIKKKKIIRRGFCGDCNNLIVGFMSRLNLDQHGKPGRTGQPFRPIVGLFSSAHPRSRLAIFEPRFSMVV